jgi:hypothetical protein
MHSLCINGQIWLSGLARRCNSNNRNKDPLLEGGTIFTALAGANFPKMILDMVVKGKTNRTQIPTVSLITVVRFFGDCDTAMVLVRHNRTIHPEFV